jgi:uncharacterized protein (DUF302 family)
VASDDPGGVVTLSVAGTVDEVLRRVVAEIEGRKLEVFAVIDHSGEAAEVGIEMPETKLVIFGSAKAGTPLMLAHPRIALDLPLKLLIAEGVDGTVIVGYNAPQYLAVRYGLTDDETKVLRGVETIAGLAAPLAQ